MKISELNRHLWELWGILTTTKIIPFKILFLVYYVIKM